MPLDSLDAECKTAIEFAKRCVSIDSELEIDVLLAAVYHTSGLADKYPVFKKKVGPPEAIHDKPVGKVKLQKSLSHVLTDVNKRRGPVTIEEFFIALVASDPGHQFLKERGVEENQLRGLLNERPAPACWRDSAEREKALRALSAYGQMLTSGAPEPTSVVEMDGALKSLAKTLVKRERRNAIIVGYPGTGKSILVYEFARRLCTGDASVPKQLEDTDIFRLETSSLRSGTSLVGEYEKRVSKVIATLQEYPKVILFIDEIHSFFQSGVHQHSPFSDANEAFKGALGRGEITCIGCTTPQEYRHYIEPDGAFARRFSVIRLEPPQRNTVVRVLEARRPDMEEFFSPLRIPDDAIDKAIYLTDEYLPSRFQPDKAIQLLDEACAYCATVDPPLKKVTDDALEKALEDIIGHSVLKRGEMPDVGKVLEKLRTKIIGRDDTLQEIAQAFVAGLGSWDSESGPRGVFLFTGPTGVGKTETAVLLSQILGGGQEALIRIDCNSLQGSAHDKDPAINRLLGVPPGYVGYAVGKGGILSRIRDLPESILLFDELEKAGPGVSQILLQIMETGKIEDSDGYLLDFRRAYLVFTTNVGSVYSESSIGFLGAGDNEQVATPYSDLGQVRKELRGAGFGEEFLGRLTHTFSFGALDEDAVKSIIKNKLESLRGTAEIRGLQLKWDPEIIPHLAAQWEPRFGVRNLNDMLKTRIKEQLNIADAQGELKGLKQVHLKLLDALPVKEQGWVGLAAYERKGNRLIIWIT